jgi:hypothetical protein
LCGLNYLVPENSNVGILCPSCRAREDEADRLSIENAALLTAEHEKQRVFAEAEAKAARERRSKREWAARHRAATPHRRRRSSKEAQKRMVEDTLAEVEETVSVGDRLAVEALEREVRSRDPDADEDSVTTSSPEDERLTEAARILRAQSTPDALIASRLGIGSKRLHEIIPPLGHHSNPAGHANWARGREKGERVRLLRAAEARKVDPHFPLKPILMKRPAVHRYLTRRLRRK